MAGWSWDMDCSPVHSALYELKQNASLCDVCIVDDTGLAIMAHSCVLAAGSPVLKNTLLLKQTATMLKKQGVSIKIGEIAAQVWDLILQYLYLGKVYTPIDVQLIEKLYAASKLLGISTLETTIASNAGQLGVDIDESKDPGTVLNVTLAPTASTDQVHQSVQVDMAREVAPVSIKTEGQTPKQTTPRPRLIMKDNKIILPPGFTLGPKVDSIASISPGKRVQVLVGQPVQADSMRPIKTEPIQNGDDDMETEAADDSYIVEGNSTGPSHKMNEGLQQVTEISKGNRFKCRYCSMLFEKKYSLVDHVADSCSVLKRSSISQKLREIMNDSTLKWTYCPNENCGNTRFRCDMEDLEYQKHLISCLMTEECKLPVDDTVEDNGCLMYLDNQVSMEYLKAVEIQGAPHRYKCEQCEFVAKKVKMSEHLAVAHGARRPYVCKMCHVSVKKIEVLIEHYITHHNQNKKPAIKVKIEAQLRTAADDEENEFNPRKKIKRERYEGRLMFCPNEDCGRQFTGQADHHRYVTHIIKCLMKEGCKSPSEFVEEVGDTLVYNDGLPSTLPTGELLQATQQLTRLQHVVRYKCNYCTVTASRDRMAHHLAVVHGKRKPFQCKDCDAAYGYMDTLVDHYTSHHTSQRFECMSCEMTFSKKDSLRRHVLMTHKREGKFIHQCKICERMFKYSHHARRHERYHMGTQNRKFKCSDCSKSFMTKQDLVRHSDVHSGRKDYLCQYCTFSSARRSNLLIHQRKHGIVYGDYLCLTCDKYFMSLARFQAHIVGKNHKGGHISQLPTKEEGGQLIEAYGNEIHMEAHHIEAHQMEAHHMEAHHMSQPMEQQVVVQEDLTMVDGSAVPISIASGNKVQISQVGEDGTIVCTDNEIPVANVTYIIPSAGEAVPSAETYIQVQQIPDIVTSQHAQQQA